MSIKKNGGIFGRNPTFNNVEVENDLRVGGDLIINGETVTGLDFEGSWNASTNTPDVTASPTVGQFWIVSVAGSTDLSGITTWDVGDWALYDGSAWQRVEGGGNGTFTKVNVDNLQLDGNRISSTNTNGNIEIVPNGTGYLDIINRHTYIRNDGYAGTGTQRGIFWYSIGNNPFLLGGITTDTDGLNYGKGDIIFKLKTSNGAGVGAATSERFRVGYSGHIKPAGNLILNAGQGIDFSATSGTGTSELFDDYEEGTFTPSFIDTNGDASFTHDLQGGKYTKVGDVVHFVIVLGTDAVTAGTGNLRISGLPFTSVNNNQQNASGAVGLVYEFTTAPSNYIIPNNATEMELYSAVNPLVASTSADMKTSTNDNRLYITGSYFTA